MALVKEWFYTKFNSSIATDSDFLALANIPPNVKLLRTVLTWWCANYVTDSWIDWVNDMPVNTIEVTRGSPPPFPADPGRDGLFGRDLLYLGTWYNTYMIGRNLGESYLISQAPGGGPGVIDTNVTRVSGAPMTVWWSWGTEFLSASAPAIGFQSRMTSAVLVEGDSGSIAQMAVPDNDSLIDHRMARGSGKAIRMD